jgi:hypothetical protein
MNVFWAIFELLLGVILAGFGLLVVLTREFPGDEPNETTRGGNAVAAGIIVFCVGVVAIIFAVKLFIGK